MHRFDVMSLRMEMLRLTLPLAFQEPVSRLCWQKHFAAAPLSPLCISHMNRACACIPHDVVTLFGWRLIRLGFSPALENTPTGRRPPPLSPCHLPVPHGAHRERHRSMPGLIVEEDAMAGCSPLRAQDLYLVKGERKCRGFKLGAGN